MPIARPGILQLVWTHRAGGLIAMCGCHYSSISLEAHLGNAFLGRGMAGGRQGADRAECFPLDIAFEPSFSRSCVEDRFIYHVLSVYLCQNKQTKIS